MTISNLRATLVIAVTLAMPPSFVAQAYADALTALRCQQTIAKETAKFVKTKATILRKCKESAVRRAVPASPVECPLTDQDDKINAAAQKLHDKIAVRCGGHNKLCNVADVGVDADEPLAAIGWDIGTCPDLSGHGCTDTIADCNDIATCAACITHSAVDRATELYYDLLVPTEFATGSAVNDCQIAIGKAATKFLLAKAKLLQVCWAKVLAAKPGFTSPPGCPATDSVTVTKLAMAEQKKVAAICKACGGGDDGDGDGLCDLPAGAFSPTSIGFEPDCPDVTIPGSPMSCAAPVATLDALVACVDCVTSFHVDCSAAVTVPSQTSYPVECTLTP